MAKRKRNRYQERKKELGYSPNEVARFSDALKESAAREKAERQRIQKERTDANRRKREAAEHAEALKKAKLKVKKAIARAKKAREKGTGIAEADEHWRVAKADLIELETGERPDW